jgi:hypothetical protein
MYSKTTVCLKTRHVSALEEYNQTCIKIRNYKMKISQFHYEVITHPYIQVCKLLIC